MIASRLRLQLRGTAKRWSGRTLAAPRPVARAAASTMAEASHRTAAIEGLQPSSVWRYFGELTQVPRPSKNEEK